jgi:hypothetical protein
MNKILYLGKLLVVLPAVPILTACIHIDHHPYPDRWGSPPFIADNVCTGIGGTFRVIGESDTGKYPIPLVYTFLSRSERKEWPPSKFDEASYVMIEQTTNE